MIFQPKITRKKSILINPDAHSSEIKKITGRNFSVLPECQYPGLRGLMFNQKPKTNEQKSNQVCAYVSEYAGNPECPNRQVELAGKVKLTKTDIVAVRETDVEKTVAPVINAARKELPNLADYGITETQITELETSVDDFNSMIGRPRTIRNQTFVAISELQELVDTANGVANNKLDNLMLLFQAAQPGFFEEYKRARVIVD